MGLAKNYILSTSRDNTLKLIDIRMHEVVQTFTDPSFRIGMNWVSSCFSPDGSYVCSGGANGMLYVWNMSTGKLETSLAGHKSAVCAVAWNPNGAGFVYSAEREKMVLMWQDKES